MGPQGADGRGTVDWEKLRESTVLSTRFLDDVVTANAYVRGVPELRQAAFAARRIGLGIMGLGDLMYHAGIRYGAPEAQEFAAQVMEFVRYYAMLTSIELARTRGPFEALAGSIYDPANLQWRPPQPLSAFERDFGRPAIDWSAVTNGILAHGIRNACQTTIAPTGTIATVAGCESYGCEPAFALSYLRHVNDRGRDLTLTYTSPLFERALAAAGVDEARRQAIVEQVLAEGTCQNISGLPEAVRHTFVVSQDISADEHVRMQAALQAFVDNSLSKTCNFAAGATPAEVAQAYQLAWEMGCKGLTVYVTGSREKVVLETHATAKAKQKAEAPTVAPAAAPAPTAALGGPAAPAPATLPLFQESKKARPIRLPGVTIQVSTPLGKAFVTVNANGGNQPFEVFITTAKAGSETAAVSEAIGRLISYILRLASPIAPRERLVEVVSQLTGIGSGRSIGFGPNRVASLPDGVARALNEYLGADEPEAQLVAGEGLAMPPPGQLALKIGDLCPECGEAALVNEEGCRKCYSCGYSQC
jgi:ribonucleoside-diphosphate reductase alpha chain